jgi:DNA-binding NtrC family response regulator
MIVLVIDDESDLLDFYHEVLSRPGVAVHTTIDPERGIELVRELSPHLIFLDLVMPHHNGIDVLRRIREIDPRPRVIVVTGQYCVETAVQVIREGAIDYVGKPVPQEKLRQLIDEALHLFQTRERVETLERELLASSSFQGMVSCSPLMLDVFEQIRRIGPHFRAALVTGETGSGKELVARALYQLSPRSRRPFVVCNCAALTESLVESQLFGSRKGAFTGATDERKGLFEAAHEGILFLDEVGELTPQTQAKLLRAVESGEIQKLGDTQSIQVDVLLIAATNRKLAEQVQMGKFRADLWYRLNMLEIHLPPLRDRKEDLPHLYRYFIEEANKQFGKSVKGLSRRAQNALNAHPWPGNVRELKNVIMRACMLSTKDFLDLDSLSSLGQASLATEPIKRLAVGERDSFLRVLRNTPNRSLAARQLGISRTKLYRMMKRFKIEMECEIAGTGSQ